MIRAEKRGLWAAVVRGYVRRKLASAFGGLWVRGVLPDARHGLVVYANHSSWWDGFVIHELGRAAGWDSYAVMEEENLAKYPFHTKLGAFSVRRGDARSALTTLKYARSLLSQPRGVVFIFPEGQLRPGDGPLGEFERGVEVLQRAAHVPALPVSLRYAFLGQELPEVLVDVGTPHGPDTSGRYRAEVEALLRRGREVRSTDEYRLLVPGRRGVRERWDAVRGAQRRLLKEGV